MLLVKYRHATGAILAVWDATDQTLLEAQREPAESEIEYLLSTATSSAREMAQHWYVVGGVAVPKAVVTLAGTPSPFTANGIATCTVTVTPFQPCTLVVDSLDEVLTVADPTLVLTSAVPWQFRIVLKPLPGVWAAPLIVEAV